MPPLRHGRSVEAAAPSACDRVAAVDALDPAVEVRRAKGDVQKAVCRRVVVENLLHGGAALGREAAHGDVDGLKLCEAAAGRLSDSLVE